MSDITNMADAFARFSAITIDTPFMTYRPANGTIMNIRRVTVVTHADIWSSTVSIETS
jgi:hypothetical protein